MKNIFTGHPNSINETYVQHLVFAGKFGFQLIIAGFACLIHAIFPFLFKSTGSNQVLKMTRTFIERMPCLDDRTSEIHDLLAQKQKGKQ